ncbi:SDR family NAD(P)-dependent oxidoreductase [Actinophytocola algeriensis]|uniref:NAD(P)-dependent dehydrogenase (Short-subunit alcohol dehydrogenase family) n=1 Tax=Actinophytocola algeriensis TaxID=1768010 RepID=A0A7W7PZR1_9PSEU|nr:SDR family oxidoreductase [Actinophytocola algeriensis]MBB4904327.1 NAD(P)-dependent dehydrogenase (short-subunit alcohol dehydrogenase family) [Actinophytocola algeriensis]MBE1476815.1 NAD(P)-dependent dehydrogenase (short-subunit alcohol dehydrogenase family) [Actinophytocola algeriensis]
MDLKDTVAVVTGGGTGIGRATALALAEEGAAGIVVTYSRSSAEAAAVAAELPCRAVAVRADVADDGQVRDLADRVREEFGRVDVLVNNAATTYRVPHHDLDGLTDDAFHQVLDVNVLGPYRMARAFAPALRESHGAVVNIASISGYRAGGSSIAYGVSKAALLQLTRNLAVALAPEVRVNAVAPGTVATRWQTALHGEEAFARKAAAERESVPLKQTAGPEHVAQAVLGLLRMDLVTGEAVILDGGKHVTY